MAKRLFFWPQFTALLLSLCLALPSPTLALRQVGLEESDPTKAELLRALGVTIGSPITVVTQRVGLEERTLETPSVEELREILEYRGPGFRGDSLGLVRAIENEVRAIENEGRARSMSMEELAERTANVVRLYTRNRWTMDWKDVVRVYRYFYNVWSPTARMDGRAYYAFRIAQGFAETWTHHLLHSQVTTRAEAIDVAIAAIVHYLIGRADLAEPRFYRETTVFETDSFLRRIGLSFDDVKQQAEKIIRTIQVIQSTGLEEMTVEEIQEGLRDLKAKIKKPLTDIQTKLELILALQDLKDNPDSNYDQIVKEALTALHAHYADVWSAVGPVQREPNLLGAIVAHDLNNPLTALFGFLDLQEVQPGREINVDSLTQLAARVVGIPTRLDELIAMGDQDEKKLLQIGRVARSGQALSPQLKASAAPSVEGAGLEEKEPLTFMQALGGRPMVQIKGFSYSNLDGQYEGQVPDDFIREGHVQPGESRILINLPFEQITGSIPLKTRRIFDQVGIDKKIIEPQWWQTISVPQIVSVPKDREGAQSVIRQMTDGDALFLDADSEITPAEISQWVADAGLNLPIVRISKTTLQKLLNAADHSLEAILRAAEAARGKVLDIKDVTFQNYEGYHVAVLTAA